MVFLFFFGGVTQEVRTEIERGVTACPACEAQASLVEYDNVFRAFFIPIWRWGGDNPAIKCTSCPFLMSLEKYTALQEAVIRRIKPSPPLPRQDWTPSAPVFRCWSCSAPMDVNYRFCPQCGSAQ